VVGCKEAKAFVLFLSISFGRETLGVGDDNSLGYDDYDDDDY